MAVIKETFTMHMPIHSIKCDECGMEFMLFCMWDKAENEYELSAWLEQCGWYTNERLQGNLFCPYCGKYVHNKPTKD